MPQIYRKAPKKQKQSFWAKTPGPMGKKPGCNPPKLKQNEALTSKPDFGFISDPFIGNEFMYAVLELKGNKSTYSLH